MIVIILILLVFLTSATAEKQKLYDPDTLEALRFDIMRVEGRLGNLAINISESLLSKMSEFVNRSSSGTGSGTATGVPERPCPDLRPLLMPIVNEMAELVKLVRESMEKDIPEPAAKSEELVNVWWERWYMAQNQPLAVFFLGWASFQCQSIIHRFVFITLGAFFSPILGCFALIVMVCWAAKETSKRVKKVVKNSWIVKCCCPRLVQEDVQEEARTQPRLVSARQLGAATDDVFEDVELCGEGDGNAALGNRHVTFFDYIRGYVNPFAYMPISARTSRSE
jgi:hypothetical protein